MQNFAANNPELVSAIHTFAATFIVTVLTAISLIPTDSIISGKTYTTAFIIGLIGSGIRAGVKAVSPLT